MSDQNAGAPIEVEQIDPATGQVVATFPSMTHAAKALGCPVNRISTAVREHVMFGGYKWKRAKPPEPPPKRVRKSALPPQLSPEEFIEQALARVRAED